MVARSGTITSPSQTNLRLIRRTRQRQIPGNVFAMLPPDDRGYLFAQVSQIGREDGLMRGSLVIHVFALRKAELTVTCDEIDQADPLIDPIWTNSRGWSVGGVFLTVTNCPVRPNRVIGAFKTYDGLVVDECRRTVQFAHEGTLGIWGLASYRSLDDKISDALGIKRAPLGLGDLDKLRARYGADPDELARQLARFRSADDS
ncbi:MAG: Imm26 family immunity protein [Dehalococcoidia bacterium]